MVRNKSESDYLLTLLALTYENEITVGICISYYLLICRYNNCHKVSTTAPLQVKATLARFGGRINHKYAVVLQAITHINAQNYIIKLVSHMHINS